MSNAPKVSTDDWAKWGSTMSRFEKEGPAVHSGRALAEYANAELPFSKATAIIDIGCGPGNAVGEVLAAHGSEIPKDARVIASDLSPGMIELVEERKGREPTWANLETKVYDAMDLSELQDGSLSHVLSGFTYFLLPDSQKGLKEALRALQSDGVFASSSIAQSSWTDLMGKVAEVRPERKMTVPGSVWATEEGVAGQLKAAGFRDVKAFSVPVYMPFDDHVEIVEYLMSTLPFMPMLTKGMTEEEIAQARDLMIRHAKQEYPTLPGKLPGVAIIGVGRK